MISHGCIMAARITGSPLFADSGGDKCPRFLFRAISHADHRPFSIRPQVTRDQPAFGLAEMGCPVGPSGSSRRFRSSPRPRRPAPISKACSEATSAPGLRKFDRRTLPETSIMPCFAHPCCGQARQVRAMAHRSLACAIVKRWILSKPFEQGLLVIEFHGRRGRPNRGTRWAAKAGIWDPGQKFSRYQQDRAKALPGILMFTGTVYRP